MVFLVVIIFVVNGLFLVCFIVLFILWLVKLLIVYLVVCINIVLRIIGIRIFIGGMFFVVIYSVYMVG